MTNSEVKIELSADIKQKIDKWLTKFPDDQRQSAVIYSLRIVQEDNGGWLSEPLMIAVADYLQMPKIAVFEVATFYHMFNLDPVGKHEIWVCNSISCHLCDSKKIIDHISNRLKIGVGETTEDQKFTLKAAECLGACRNAPVMQINTDYYENLTEDKVDKILEKLQ